MPKVDRLYPLFQPSHYELSIEPDLEKLSFVGNLKIKGRLTKRSKLVRLHGRRLEVNACSLQQGPASHVPIRIEIKPDQEEIHLYFDQYIETDGLEISFDYRGIVDTNPHGLYRSNYQDGGQAKYLLASQFESTHARNLMPCIDEPAAKAVFQLSLTTPKDFVAVSNTLAQTEETQDSNKVTVFKPTPRMSTYLLAVIAGNWKYKETKTISGTIIRTYAIPSQIKYASESLDIAKQALEFYENYFGMKYPLENLNQIAIPDMEPGVGAMENWGCVVYRADSLLMDPHHTSQSMRIYNTIVICHELAHMWFGNLVTMEWWDDLWLNEGFASWIEYKAADIIRPDWHIWREFVSNDMIRTMRQDSYSTTHPVYSDIQDPAEITQAFDDITYRKGSSSIRMLESYLGEDIFREGLRSYMRQFAYQNASRDNLWQVLEDTSKQPVKAMMDSWLKTSGHPVISYQTIGSRSLELKQQIFRYRPARSQQVWPVPIQILGVKESYTLSGQQSNWQLNKPLPKPIKLNTGHSSFIRVLPGPDDLRQLSDLLAADKLPALDAIGLLADQLDLTVAGKQSIANLLDTAMAARNVAIAEVWDQIAAAIGWINLVFGSNQIESLIKPYVHQIIEPLYKRLGWSRSKKISHNDKNLQLTILGLAARFDYPEAIKKIDSIYKQLRENRSIDPDIREIVLATIARRGTMDDYKQMLKWYERTDQSEEQRRLARAMTNFRQPDLAKRSLKFMQGSKVRTQDAYAWLIYLARNRFTRDIAWDFMQQEWVWIYATYERSLVIRYIVEGMLGSFADQDKVAEAKKFFKSKDTKRYARGLQNGVEIILFQSAWKKRDSKALENYLANFQ